MRIRILFALCILLTVCLPSWAGSLFLMSMSGDTIGRLPYLEKGEEKLIPLTLLSTKAGWKTEVVNGLHIIKSPISQVSLRRNNPFQKIDDHYVQLPVAPDEWDGSLWLPASSLCRLFSTSILDYDSFQKSIKVERIISMQDSTAANAMLKADSSFWKLKTVIVDPGHGGRDSGARGLFGLIEKDLTLDIAKRLVSNLQINGVTAELTRDQDSFVPLSERTQYANAKHGDLFVSIHINSSTDSNARGIETYFLKPARTQRAIEVALRENGVVELEDNNSEYKELTDQNYILLTMATSQYLKDSEKWAALSLNLAKKNTGLTMRNVDQAGFYVLIGASMPAILFECGFLTNPGDAHFLATEPGRQKLADALSESIMNMKTTLEASITR